MQQLGRPVDGGAADDAERLVAEAHAEHRLLALGAGLDHRHRDPGLLGRARAGRDAARRRSRRPSSGATASLRTTVALRAELLEVADDREDEAVVVVDDEDAGHAVMVHRRRHGPTVAFRERQQRADRREHPEEADGHDDEREHEALQGPGPGGSGQVAPQRGVHGQAAFGVRQPRRGVPLRARHRRHEPAVHDRTARWRCTSGGTRSG